MPSSRHTPSNDPASVVVPLLDRGIFTCRFSKLNIWFMKLIIKAQKTNICAPGACIIADLGYVEMRCAYLRWNSPLSSWYHMYLIYVEWVLNGKLQISIIFVALKWRKKSKCCLPMPMSAVTICIVLSYFPLFFDRGHSGQSGSPPRSGETIQIQHVRSSWRRC